LFHRKREKNTYSLTLKNYIRICALRKSDYSGFRITGFYILFATLEIGHPIIAVVDRDI
jgi:hypothetical protein